MTHACYFSFFNLVHPPLVAQLIAKEVTNEESKESESVPADQEAENTGSEVEKKDETKTSEDNTQKPAEQEADETAKETTESQGDVTGETAEAGEEPKPNTEQENTGVDTVAVENAAEVKQDVAEADKKVENIESEAVVIDGTTEKGGSEGKIEGNMEETSMNDEPKKDAEETAKKEGEGEQVTEGDSQDVKQEDAEVIKEKTAEESESKDAEEGKTEVTDGEKKGEEQEAQGLLACSASFHL